MINLDAINKNNVIKEPFEYMCIDFIDRDYVKESFNKFKQTYKIEVEFDEFKLTSPHPVQEFIEEYLDEIVNRINDVWNLDVVTCTQSTSLFDKTSELDTHNDYNYDGNFSIPARGIIYLNDEKVFGTNIYKEERGEPTEIGGHPGQLFLFKVWVRPKSMICYINNLRNLVKLRDNYSLNSLSNGYARLGASLATTRKCHK